MPQNKCYKRVTKSSQWGQETASISVDLLLVTGTHKVEERTNSFRKIKAAYYYLSGGILYCKVMEIFI